MSFKQASTVVIGLDATNIRGGGGVTYLTEVLAVASPERFGISQVIIWGNAQVLAKIPSKPWLKKITNLPLKSGLIVRTCWQLFKLSKEAKFQNCSVLWVPGGSYGGWFKPFVAMSMSMLPFEFKEMRRYGISNVFFKLLLLKYVQAMSFARANGVLFLSEYARRSVEEVTGVLRGNVLVTAFGINKQFNHKPRQQRPITEYSNSNPFRILYVSFVGPYKHQWNVVEAIHLLRKEGYPVVLDLVGPLDHEPSVVRLHKSIDYHDPDHTWCFIHGSIPYSDLLQFFLGADLFVFASSCESLPNILLESMASGLPIACSNRGPMPEILGDAGLYFDPENPSNIAKILHQCITSPELRTSMSLSSHEFSKLYTWERCADQTFRFLSEIASKGP